MKQREVVELLAQRGIKTHQPTITTFEKGKQVPNLYEGYEIAEILGVSLYRLLDPHYLPPPEWEELFQEDEVRRAERSLEDIEDEAAQREVSRQEGTLNMGKEKQLSPEQLRAIRDRIDDVEEQIAVCREFISNYEEVEPGSPDVEIERKELSKLETELKGLRA